MSERTCEIDGKIFDWVTALAREYGCDTNVIYKIVRGTYVVGSN